MIKSFTKYHPAVCLISVIGMLFTTFADLRADEPVSLSTNVAEGTKGFLSDPGRAGSLVGTIIAGAAIANPLAPILGSLAGYFVGKETDYTNNNIAQQNSYARRSLIPENDRQVAILSGLTGKQPQLEERLTILGLAAEPGAGEQPKVMKLVEEPGAEEQPRMLERVEEPESGEQPQTAKQSIKLELPSESKGKGNLQQQIAYACSNVQITKQLPVYCYYYSQ